jgi:hypothetical protein
MNNRKIIFVLTLAFALAFIGCDNWGDDKTHTHDYSATWSKNATQHWHECSCGDKKDVANHTNNPCTVCGYETFCTCPESTTHEPDDQCCEGTDCNCQIAEPEDREFTVSFNFANPGNPDEIYNANIEDVRTACGSATMEDIKVGEKSIVTIIEEAIQGSFNTKPTNNAQRGRFRNVFYKDGVTIIVDNPETLYKMSATDTKTIYIHIDYLKNTPADIQQKVFDMVTAMNTGGASLPYNAE